MQKLIKFLLTNFLLLVLLGTTAEAAFTVAKVDSLDEAFSYISTSLKNEPIAFFSNQASLLISTEIKSKSNTPLNAVLELSGKQFFSRSQNLDSILLPADLPFGYEVLNDKNLHKLDRFGVDRVLDISASIRGQKLYLAIRAIWLDGGSFASVLASPFSYHELLLSLIIKADGQWASLAIGSENGQQIVKSWKLEKTVTTSGRVLDMLAKDIDDDGITDLLLLFEDRLEVYLGVQNSFQLKYTHNLLDYQTSEIRSRFVVGELVFCGTNSNHLPLIAFGTNAIKQSVLLSWDGEMLVEEMQFDYVPLYFEHDNLIAGKYKLGSYLFEPVLYTLSKSFQVKSQQTSEGSFLSADFIADDSEVLLTNFDGTIQFTQNPQRLGLRCGIHPHFLDASLLVCSNATMNPKTDRLVVWRILTNGVREEYQATPMPGAYYAIDSNSSIDANNYTNTENIYAARYQAESDKTTIDHLSR